MTRSAAQKQQVRVGLQKSRAAQRKARAEELYAKGTAKIIQRYGRRHTREPVERETLAEYEARGGQVTRCEAITDDPEQAIARARAASRRECAPRVIKATPRNTRKE